MKNLLRKLFLQTKDVERSSYIWNAVYGIVFALQSAVLLMVINRTNGLDDAGVFSIAYAIATLISFIGDFGVRKYQVSDIREENSFADYFTSRILTCSVMMLACLGAAVYGVLFNSYSVSKFIVIMLMGLVKLVESFADVFYGRFQQKGRLDVAAKANSFRIAFGMCCCSAALILTHDLVISSVVWVLSSFVGFCCSMLLVSPEFCTIRVHFAKVPQLRIIRECLPLFIGAFLLIYLGNASKYAIDAYMDDASQACYNFIYMPVFAIGLLANFVFNPVLVTMSENWDTGNYKAFHRIIWKQQGVIAALTILAVLVALTIGCPVLGILYHADLSEFKMELVVLMIGGGMLALVNFYTVVITVIRCQKHLTAGYIGVALIAWIMAGKFVQGYGIMGAAVLYTALMTLLAIVFAGVLLICDRLERKKC